MRQLIRFALVLAVACGKDSSTQPTMASVAGSWVLTSVNGASLPAVISQTGTAKVEMVSNVVTAMAAGAYTDVYQVRTTINGQSTTTTTTVTGTFSVSGTSVTLHSSTGGSSAGTIAGNTFTMNQDGLVLVFTKQ